MAQGKTKNETQRARQHHKVSESASQRAREQRSDWNECVNTEQRVKYVFKNVFAIWIETALDALEFRYARTLSHILLFLLFLKYSHL